MTPTIASKTIINAKFTRTDNYKATIFHGPLRLTGHSFWEQDKFVLDRNYGVLLEKNKNDFYQIPLGHLRRAIEENCSEREQQTILTWFKTELEIENIKVDNLKAIINELKVKSEAKNGTYSEATIFDHPPIF